MYNLRTKTVMESSNVVINDEVCSKAHPESTTQVQDKPVEVNDTLPVEYVVKHSDEELVRISALKSYCVILCMLLCMTLCIT